MKNVLSEYALILLGAIWVAFGGWVLISDLFQPRPVTIQWSTETEFDTAGFNIYRSDEVEGTFEQVNVQLIPAKADAAAGATYTWEDKSAEAGQTYFYQLEDVEFNNARTRHEPFPHTSAGISPIKLGVALSALVFGIALMVYGRVELRRRKVTQSSLITTGFTASARYDSDLLLFLAGNHKTC